jgi:hypothetical protein
MRLLPTLKTLAKFKTLPKVGHRSFSRTRVLLASDLMSRVRIVEDEKECRDIVDKIMQHGEPVAVDVEVPPWKPAATLRWRNFNI